MGQITIESDLILLIPNPHNEMKWGEVGGGRKLSDAFWNFQVVVEQKVNFRRKTWSCPVKYD